MLWVSASLLAIECGFVDSRVSRRQRSVSAAMACSYTADCPVHQYCDYGHSCYHCSYLSEKCDAVDGDCCSAMFRHNCPTDPLESKCEPCEAALVAACNSTRTKTFECAQCSGVHQHDLMAAGCTNDQVAKWCAGLPLSPPQCPNIVYAWNETRELVGSPRSTNCTVPSRAANSRGPAGARGVPQDPLSPPSGPRAPFLDSLKRTETPPGTP